MEKETKRGLLNIKKAEVIPLIVFVLIFILLIISSTLTGRPPEIESLNKKICLPGEELIIYGKYFGKNRDGGKVIISGKSLSYTAYQEWSNKKISFIAPEDLKSGLVSVLTDKGESAELILLINQQDIPVIAAGPSRPGEPYITDLSPIKSDIGSVITLTGLNFGQNQEHSNVFFTWVSDTNKKYDKDDIFSSLVPAQDYDFDYLNWSDSEIKVRIPDGAAPGPVLVATEKGISSPLYLEVQEPFGKKTYTSKITYQVSYTIEINNINSEQGNGLYLWLPRILNAPEQREIKSVNNEPESLNDSKPLLENYKGLMQYYFEDLLPGGKYQIKVNFIFDRYAVHTTVSNIQKIKDGYAESKNYLAQYIQANSMIPSADAKMKRLANTVTKGISNPYLKARAFYDYLLKKLSYSDDVVNRNKDIVELINSAKPAANSLDYALLFCTLARCEGIPARPVGGYLISNTKQSKAHFWAEFYIEALGWIPVDPVYGSGNKPLELEPQGDFREFYFGSMDNQHIMLSRGIINIGQMNPRGRIVTSMKSPAIQSIYEESIGKLHSYSSEWSVLEDIGIY